jgi:hypothetical protein
MRWTGAGGITFRRAGDSPAAAAGGVALRGGAAAMV